MVFKSFTHIARPSFSKGLGHGYAQSFVAATQSSYASTTTPYPRPSRLGRPQTAQLHTTYQNALGQSEIAAKSNFGASETVDRKDGDPNLRGYYEALWKRQQTGEEAKEWTQFQFAKRIEWSPPSVVPAGNAQERANLAAVKARSHSHGGLDRAYSTSAVDDIKRAEDEVAEAAAVAKVDEAIAQVITQIQRSPPSTDGNLGVGRHSAQQHPVNELGDSPAPLSVSPIQTASPRSSVTVATSVQDTDPRAFSEHISKLHEQLSYDQIPPVFESMVLQGLQPTTEDYNALLASAIHLPIAKHQVVPKALSIYSNMLRRKISPDTTFYTSLICALSQRTLDVVHMKSVLNKERLRFGGIMGKDSFLFPSNEAEYDILAHDDALSNAIKIFRISTALDRNRQYTAETYQSLITACASKGEIDEMIGAYTHMESHKVKPIAAIFPPMIEAFAKSGDLSSAIECYNEYKNLAIADDAGQFSIINRNDNEVYAAVVKAYAICGKLDGGNRFFGRILESYANVTENRKERLEAVQDAVIFGALIKESLDASNFVGALRLAEERSLTPFAKTQAMAKICISAADHGDVESATKAFQYLSRNASETPATVLSMLALRIRQGNLDAASELWALPTSFEQSFVEPAALYAVALIRSGLIDQGLMQARKGFGRIRAAVLAPNSRKEVTEEIDEAIEFIGAFLADNHVVPSPSASMNFLWAMVENGGLVSPVAEQMLAGLGSEDIANLSWQDTILALQVEAGLLANGDLIQDVTHSARFAHLLEIVVASGISLDERTTRVIEKALGTLADERPDLLAKWQSHHQLPIGQAHIQRTFTPQSGSVVSSGVPLTDTYDPYATTTDYRGSTIIVDELENCRNSAGLNEALIRFRNIRRAGRHPRYIVYAKLISAAAKEGRSNLIHDIIGMARTDIPLLPQYSVVRHGWSTILDSMVGACLVAGRRQMAAQFHQELLDMGSAPTANTFGLYITTLKDSTKTFDEASEAVAIFGRAVSEGAVPSSFLYNALIGKLGKARRIDDCLRYFQEMRAAGIRPTSVTYGTVVNALCRVSDERFAEQLFDEMESMPNYKARPAPYNSLMQYFLTTKRDSKKVLSYYDRMQSMNIQPTMHTYKLLIDTYATLEPVNLPAAEGILATIRASGQRPEAVHYASFIHAKGCALHDMEGARRIFDEVLASGEIRPQACLYQALFESMVANHCVGQTEAVLAQMAANRVEMTPYIANTLIHGWATENNIAKSRAMYDSVGMEKREPSTYEAMTRAFLTAKDRDGALATVHEMLARGYPSAVSGKILELIGHGMNRIGSVALSDLPV
jgi:pentatricopeptide repeat protein